MNNLPRQKLIEIIALYGPTIIDDPRKVEGLLRDLCGGYKREIIALMDAARERVATDLRDSSHSQPFELLIKNLTRRLIDNRPMAEDMAHWSVETWALALGIIVAIESDDRAKPYSSDDNQATPRQMAQASENKKVRIEGDRMFIRLAKGV
jgi:hypothetical protein